MARPAGALFKLEPAGDETGDIALVTEEEQDADQVVERDAADLLLVPAPSLMLSMARLLTQSKHPRGTAPQPYPAGVELLTWLKSGE
jgi:hypothetical protein